MQTCIGYAGIDRISRGFCQNPVALIGNNQAVPGRVPIDHVAHLFDKHRGKFLLVRYLQYLRVAGLFGEQEERMEALRVFRSIRVLTEQMILIIFIDVADKCPFPIGQRTFVVAG